MLLTSISLNFLKGKIEFRLNFLCICQQTMFLNASLNYFYKSQYIK